METMATVVQSYLVEETKELILDGDKLAEWTELVAELNLAGQLDTVSGDKSPIPFLHIKPNMMNVIQELCPRCVEIDEYKITPIPIDVLKLVKLAKHENYFQKINIHFDDKTPDPFVVGVTGYWFQASWNLKPGEPNLANAQFLSKEDAKAAGILTPYFREEVKYLIAKWGDVSMSFEELSAKAKSRFIELKGAEYRKTIKESQNSLNCLEEDAIEKFTL